MSYPRPSHSEKWDWNKRRKAILARPDRVPVWVTAFGFIAQMGLDPDSGMSREAELRYLEETQNHELAPIAAELLANHVRSMSLNGMAPRQAGEDSQSYADRIGLPDPELLAVIEPMGHDEDPDDYAIRLGLKDGQTAPYELPDRREMWWRDTDQYNWECGPVVSMQVTGPDSVRVFKDANLSDTALKAIAKRLLSQMPSDTNWQALQDRQRRADEAKRIYGKGWAEKWFAFLVDDIDAQRGDRLDRWLRWSDRDPNRFSQWTQFINATTEPLYPDEFLAATASIGADDDLLHSDEDALWADKDDYNLDRLVCDDFHEAMNCEWCFVKPYCLDDDCPFSGGWAEHDYDLHPEYALEDF